MFLEICPGLLSREVSECDVYTDSCESDALASNVGRIGTHVGTRTKRKVLFQFQYQAVFSFSSK